MKTDEIVSRLGAWRIRHDQMMAQYDALNALTGADPECPLMVMVFGLWDEYTVAVSEIVGDEAGWLSWYANDCDMGAYPKDAVTPGGKTICVKTLRHLARMIKA